MISFTQKYFFLYLLRARNRQKLLIFSLLALALSSFALLVIQSTMGGMQSQVVKRSKSIEGSYQLILGEHLKKDPSRLTNFLKINKLLFLKEITKELLIKSNNGMRPVIVHGVDKIPFFIKKQYSDETDFELLLPYTISVSENIEIGDFATIYSPFKLDSFITDIPYRITLRTTKLFESNLPEIDNWHIWIKLSKLQNLIRQRSFNKITLFSDDNHQINQEILKLLKLKFSDELSIIAWEETHQTLTWALKLENFVMIFLFASMSLLVTLSIISGFLLFWEKVRSDLAYFWVVGVSKKNAFDTVFKFIINLNIFSIILGLIIGTIFLFVFQKIAPDLMPDVFVDRSIPVIYKLQFFLVAFFTPLIISFVFSFSLTKFLHNDTDFFKSLKRTF